MQFLAYIAKKSVTFDKTESVIDKFEFLDIKTNNNIFSVTLDIDSMGLLVLTQDGRVAKTIIGETSDVDKEYIVRVGNADGTVPLRLSDKNLALLNHGLSLDGVALLPAKVTRLNADELQFVLREGKKRQIRRMCEAVGLKVLRLKRVRIGRVRLGDLPLGAWRYLGENEAF